MHAYSVLLDVELAYFVPHDVTKTTLTNPLPHGCEMFQLGWGSLKIIKDKLTRKQIRTVAFCKLKKLQAGLAEGEEEDEDVGGPDLVFDRDLDAANITRNQTPQPPRGSTPQHSFSNRLVLEEDGTESVETGEIIAGAWSVDYSHLETSLVDLVLKTVDVSDLNLAIQIYSCLASSGKSALPQINDDFLGVVRFWMIKKYFSKAKSLRGWFEGLVEFILSVYTSCFCPCPIRSNVNVFPLGKAEVLPGDIEKLEFVLEYVRDGNAAMLSHSTGIYRGYCYTDGEAY